MSKYSFQENVLSFLGPSLIDLDHDFHIRRETQGREGALEVTSGWLIFSEGGRNSEAFIGGAERP